MSACRCGGVAKHILEAPVGELNITTKKIRALRNANLKHASETGKSKLSLHGLIQMVRINLKADARANEQFNSLLPEHRARQIRCKMLLNKHLELAPVAFP